MNKPVNIPGLPSRIFDFNISEFDEIALAVFRFQYNNNQLYRQYCDLINKPEDAVKSTAAIPFLPISFFKSHAVITGDFVPEAIFESSGTTQSVTSRHQVRSLDIYTESFTKTFQLFYSCPHEYCVLGLLPSYLERQNSSLVVMVNELIAQSRHPLSGFYLNDYGKLHQTLQQLEQQGQKTLLIGVTFALLDFAELYPIPLHSTIIMETGGMKGRKEEMIRPEVHERLKQAFKVDHIHSEYGMTELLSQAYSPKEGRFYCPPWMKITVRRDDDPLDILFPDRLDTVASGVINVVDLANLYSCSFIGTDDAGKLYPDGSFEVLGRTDNSDIRGCSLLAL